jgi:hypothetical protein
VSGVGRGGQGTIAEVVAWYAEYSGYRDRVMLSVKAVEPMNSAVNRTAPSTVGCSSEPAATAPKAKMTHHWACSNEHSARGQPQNFGS